MRLIGISKTERPIRLFPGLVTPPPHSGPSRTSGQRHKNTQSLACPTKYIGDRGSVRNSVAPQQKLWRYGVIVTSCCRARLLDARGQMLFNKVQSGRLNRPLVEVRRPQHLGSALTPQPNRTRGDGTVLIWLAPSSDNVASQQTSAPGTRVPIGAMRKPVSQTTRGGWGTSKT
jgi:hypothetical protein